MDTEKTEYGYLLGCYLQLSVFDPFTSTFTYLQRKLQEVMPKVQDREALQR